jgi:hypothetical protein
MSELASEDRLAVDATSSGLVVRAVLLVEWSDCVKPIVGGERCPATTSVCCSRARGVRLRG